MSVTKINKRCENCNKQLINVHPNTKYCDKCAKKRKLENIKKWQHTPNGIRSRKRTYKKLLKERRIAKEVIDVNEIIEDKRKKLFKEMFKK